MKPQSARKLALPLLLLFLFLSPRGTQWQEQRQTVQEVTSLLTSHRADLGLPPLSGDPALRRAALLRAGELTRTGYLSHTRPDGSSFDTALTESGAGFTFAAENLGYYKSADPAAQSGEFWMSGWLSSPGHARNLSDKHFTRSETVILCRDIGGVYEYFAVQLFSGD